MTRLVKLTRSSHPDDDWFVNPEQIIDVDEHENGSVIHITRLYANQETGYTESAWFVIEESPAEVARLLAGGEGETISVAVTPDGVEVDESGLYSALAQWRDKCAALTAEVERLLAGGETTADYIDEVTFVRLCDERDALTAEVERLKGELRLWEETEALLLPEDVSFKEYIAALKRERDEAVSWCKANKQFLESVTLERDHAQQVEVPAAIERAEDAERERDEAVKARQNDHDTLCNAFKLVDPAREEERGGPPKLPIGHAISLMKRFVAERDEARHQLVDIATSLGFPVNDGPGHLVRAIEKLRAIAPAPEPEDDEPEFSAIRLIADERQRQVSVEGWSIAHDDLHDAGELANAAASYAMHPEDPGSSAAMDPPDVWPWDAEWWRPVPGDRIRELTKAGALIVAEMERLHRAGDPAPAPEPEETDEPEALLHVCPNCGHDNSRETTVKSERKDGVLTVWHNCVECMQVFQRSVNLPTREPAGEVVDEGDDPGTDGEMSRDDPVPEPAPATPTTALPTVVPPSTSGITVLSAGAVLPLTRNSDRTFLRGCSFVLFLTHDGDFVVVKDNRATDGPAPGTIRWRVNNGGDPFGDDRASSSKAVLLKADTVVSGAPTWPEANGPISVADLGPPLTDADGSRWWRVEAWSDESATANKSEASTRATVFFVCVLAPGVEAPRPPAVGYHASDPIVIGSPVVHPIVFTTDADPSPGAGETAEPLLYEGIDQLASTLRDADPALKTHALGLHRDNFQSRRGGKYAIDRTAGHHLTLRPPRIRHFDFSALCTAVRLLTGEATAEDKAFLRLYALNNGLSAPEIAIGEHGDTTALWGGFSYYAFREVACAAFVYSWGRRFGLWTPSEEARIRDQLARFVWTSLQLHRNPYRKWIHANGSTQAMWESARDQVSGLVALVMPGYFSEQYGHVLDWGGFFIDGINTTKIATESNSGLYGLLSSEPRWNASPSYFTSHNCAGPLALTLTCLANAGEEVPDHYEDAFLLALDGKLPGAEGKTFWSPLMVNDHFPRLRDAILAKHGKAAVLDAAKEISTASKTDPAKPGGMGAGTAVLSLLSIDFGGAS